MVGMHVKRGSKVAQKLMKILSTRVIKMSTGSEIKILKNGLVIRIISNEPSW